MDVNNVVLAPVKTHAVALHLQVKVELLKSTVLGSPQSEEERAAARKEAEQPDAAEADEEAAEAEGAAGKE